MNDPLIRRVNALVTTFLDLLATLLFAGAVGYAAWVTLGVAAGLGFAAVMVTLLSMLAQRQARPKVTPAGPDDDDTITLPGPTDPGNLHVMGR